MVVECCQSCYSFFYLKHCTGVYMQSNKLICHFPRTIIGSCIVVLGLYKFILYTLHNLNNITLTVCQKRFQRDPYSGNGMCFGRSNQLIAWLESVLLYKTFVKKPRLQTFPTVDIKAQNMWKIFPLVYFVSVCIFFEGTRGNIFHIFRA